MSAFAVYSNQIEIQMEMGIDIKDITLELTRLILESKIKEGNLSATVIGSTGSLTTMEYEPGLVHDLKRIITKIAPPNQTYEHEKAWQDGNGHSHVQAALMTPSVSAPIREGRLKLGTWQQVVLINHDIQPRKRTVEVTVMGAQ